MSSIACCRAERRTSRSCSRRGTSSSRDALHACAHRPAAAASSKQQAMCACSSGGSSSRSCTIADAALYSFLVYSRLYSKKRAVERYTAPSHPTTPLQSYTAYTALYTIQLYTAIQLIQYTALFTHPLSQATHSPLRDWGPAASHQLRTGTGDSVPSHWLGTDWGLGTQSPARGLGLGTESSADARDCCGTGHWSPGLSHLKILILTAMSLDITTEL